MKWINDLKDPASGAFLPHLLPVDPTLHWANPPGGEGGRDGTPTFENTPGRYTGPVPFVTHLHGGHSTEESDGYAEAWYLPAASDIPAGFAEVGTWYNAFKAKFASAWGVTWERGTATFQYDNDQPAARSSTRIAGSSSTDSRDPTFPTATSRRSGTLSSSATRSS